jgi:hypothetical protein
MSIRDPTKDSYASVSSLRSGEFGRGTRGLAANDFSAPLAMSNVELRHQAASGASRTVGLVSMPNRGEE